jgi:hypothetical protein
MASVADRELGVAVCEEEGHRSQLSMGRYVRDGWFESIKRVHRSFTIVDECGMGDYGVDWFRMKWYLLGILVIHNCR